MELTGRTFTGTVVHHARFVKIDTWGGELYEPLCNKMSKRTVCYLYITNKEVTCKQCLKKVERMHNDST
jgi:hypothetical protein